MKKFVEILKKIFGVAIICCLFAGGLSFLGYVVALCIGGEVATAICLFIFDKYLPWVIRITTITTFVGLIIMYMEKQKALTITADKE